MRLPASIRHRHSLLRRWANGLRAFYGAPVYLVGSALRKRKPRDVDVRLRLSDADFFKRYAITAEQWQEERATGLYSKEQWLYADDCVKRTREGQGQTFLPIDFQVYPARNWRRYRGKARFRLDTR